MIVTLLYKEWRLTLHSAAYLFLCFGALTLVPNYPYGMVFFFGALGLYFTTVSARENNDMLFAAMLPVDKAALFKGRHLLFVTVEMAQLCMAIPFALIRSLVFHAHNGAGIEANAAWFGFGLMIYTVFNGSFLLSWAKNPAAAGKAFVKAAIPVCLLIGIEEGLAFVPALAFLDSTAWPDLIKQLPLLILGIAVYCLGNIGIDRVGRRRLETTDF